MGRRRDAERTYNGSGKRLSLYLDVNGSLDGCTPPEMTLLTSLIRVCQTADVRLLLVLLNVLLQTTEFLTENHRAAGACLCACVCVCVCVWLPVSIFRGS